MFIHRVFRNFLCVWKESFLQDFTKQTGNYEMEKKLIFCVWKFFCVISEWGEEIIFGFGKFYRLVFGVIFLKDDETNFSRAWKFTFSVSIFVNLPEFVKFGRLFESFVESFQK